MESKPTLYTRDGCHLCELAAQVIERAGYRAEPVDITRRIDLLERYRDVIPVLRYEDAEIGWPFAEDDVKRLLES